MAAVISISVTLNLQFSLQKSGLCSVTLHNLCLTAQFVGLCPRLSSWVAGGIRMLWQSFNLMHTLVLIRTSLGDCCYRVGCTLSYRPLPVTALWRLRRTASHHTPVFNTHPSASRLTCCHQSCHLAPSLPSSSPEHPCSPILFFFPSFSTSLFL